jgi:NADP-dependent 3-hydroxy acid dehydrogenase YdfG
VDEVSWVVGGGSGIGRAAAVALARTGPVVVSGRRPDALQDTVAAVAAEGHQAHAETLDVRSDEDVTAVAARIAATHGPITRLVFSAGTNTPRRWWDDLSPSDFADVTDVNLTGAVRAVQAVLPGMTARGDGLVVLVSSWAGWRFSPGAGAAYSASKTALGALAETLNQQSGRSGVRATHLCPGEVATDILDTRPVPPSAADRALMLSPADVGDAVAWLASRPAGVCVNELVISPTANANYR